MKLAIASGKGGTGKTTIAVSLSRIFAQKGIRTSYVDCDVEEPNGHIFLKPTVNRIDTATVMIPHVDESRCTACGACVDACAYRALLLLGTHLMVYEELCHGCGGCILICKESALTEKRRAIGSVSTGTAGTIRIAEGSLTVGEAMSPPLIRRVLGATPAAAITVIDAPPGTSCPMVNAIRNADRLVFVAEPTPFSLHDLELALAVADEMAIPYGVVLNKVPSGETSGHRFLQEKNILLLGTIPEDRDLAAAYAHGDDVLDSKGIAAHALRDCAETVLQWMAP